MARIRSIKPEFWTDEKIVKLPFSARLLFIGMWNFCDDDGYLADEAERLKLQIFPAENEDVATLVDLLVAAEFIERFILDDGSHLLRVAHFDKHQKISHPARTKFSLKGARKVAIPVGVRREIALKYGCPPGGTKDVECYYCKSPGSIHWFPLSNGRPGYWVAFGGVEIDHFTPEGSGGKAVVKNLVLSCRYCNRSKGMKDGLSFLESKAPEPSGTLRPEGNGIEGKGVERKGEGPRMKEGETLMDTSIGPPPAAGRRET